MNPNVNRTDVRPGALCWTRPRPFEAAKLMLVVARQVSNVAVLELPVAPLGSDAENGLEVALSQLKPATLAVSGVRSLGSVAGQLLPEQLVNVKAMLEQHLFSAAA